MKYRVNFGAGQVTPQTFKTHEEAKRFIEASKQYGGDPFVGRYFVEFWDPVGGWFPVQPRASKAGMKR